MGVFLYNIPLVDQHDDTDPFLKDQARDVCILRRDSLHPVEHQQSHI
jgi:hypothetical protein